MSNSQFNKAGEDAKAKGVVDGTRDSMGMNQKYLLITPPLIFQIRADDTDVWTNGEEK